MTSLDKDQRQALLAAQRALMTLIASPNAHADDPLVQQQRYEALGMPMADAKRFASHDERHLHVYRKLIINTVTESIRAELPRTAARLGENFEAYVQRYCNEQLPRQQLLRHVAFEFAAWASPRWQEDAAVADFIADLARYELLEFDTHLAERGMLAAPYPDIDGNLAVCFDGSLRLGQFEYAVEQLAEDEADRSIPEHRALTVLLFRDPNHQIHRICLSPLSFTVISSLWLDGITLVDAVRHAAVRHGQLIDSKLVSETSDLLADLAARRVVLGATPAKPSPEPPSPWAIWLLNGETPSKV